MESAILSTADDEAAIRALMGRLGARSTVVDFDEQIQLASVRGRTRLWRQGAQLIGFAYVDDFNNLWFDTDPAFAPADQLESEIVAWGLGRVTRRPGQGDAPDALDCCCEAEDSQRIAMLQRQGFLPLPVRTLRYSRPLSKPIQEYPLPAGFSIRPVSGLDEVQQLVDLQHAAFQSSLMTVEQRRTMMSTTRYVRELDLVAVAPGGELVAFCVCGFLDDARRNAYTEPIGTRPAYQQMGLGAAVASAGLLRLKAMGAATARLGTSSENVAMQRLALRLGFIPVSEKLWFSRTVASAAAA